MLSAIAAIAPISIIGVVFTARSWWEGLTMMFGYLLALGVLRAWSLDGYPRHAIFALAFTAATWTADSLRGTTFIGFVPLALVGGMLLMRTGRWRIWVGFFAVGVAAIGASAFAFRPPTWTLFASYVVVPLIGTLFVFGVILTSEQAWLIARRLDRAKQIEADLAVARERVRFAGDLHDIQGHSLHVIKLKAALARKVMRTDPDRADAELGEIRRIADETITQTQSLAYAHHELNLVAELENAKRLCQAAGLSVEARFDGDPGAATHPLLAQVLREATTNLLRHAHPTSVSITASPVAVEVANDGLGDGLEDGAEMSLRGLARLRARVEAADGTLDITRTPERFVVTARIPADSPERMKEMT
ncbi:two-component system sensor histidine kinase DesK [Microbacterium sp. SLBN-154]|uniref:sensor histidine kinase n=1 Tax=Microbacterium sp. SLBN-154 TaxID=2768458 RepID=UPI001167354A|nr:histidine kinase [Microbacterium sp. SLBN-154]TQK18591.1 two-component system sensor histidine kinase DesK [Microbacterium sp. SLBN-154]